MPCRFASSGTVATSRSASRAILALNAASNFLRDLVISVLHRLRQSRTLHTLTFGPISGVHFTLPWSTEIVALTCGTQNCLRPPSSLLKRPRQACCATPVQDQKCWNTAAFEQSQFIGHTAFPAWRGQDR